MSRVSEVAPTEHPAFPHLIRGEEGPLLLSQLISDRQLRNTNLYHDAYRQLDIRYQIILPLTTGTHVGGVTISRGTSDFTEPETALCAPLARQVILAFDTDQALNHSREASHEVQKTDFTHLRRLGLTVRESEVLWWIGQGKRDREIALILGISPRTINRHVCGLLTKLNAETRTAALARIG
jgi:DNA-binding CsgD family transcriptional regulator